MGWTNTFMRKQDVSRVHRIMSLDEVDIDGFWKNYLKSNRGLVCSRTKDELNWAFGDEMKSGAVHMLAYIRGGEMLGYVVLRSRDERRLVRWMVVDWIADGDNREILGELLYGAKRHLQTITEAAFVEVIGYPMFVQDLIRTVFPYCRKAPGNSFSYRIDDENLRAKFENVKEVSWFFGAYDGDRCLG